MTTETMVTSTSAPSLRPLLARAADEFALTTVLLFLAVTVVRWLRDPGSALCIADLDAALAGIGAVSGLILTALILSPPGRRSGGHTNPAVTVALWLMGAFPGRGVLPYVVAQLAGSAAGTGLARLVWGRAVSLPSVAHAAIRPAAGWQPASVFLAEAGSMTVLILVVGFFMARPGRVRRVPYVIGLFVALVIALLGPRSGGSINPARQFGPAALSGQTADLWIYLVAPVLGAALGAWGHRLLVRRRRTHRLVGPPDATGNPSGRGGPGGQGPGTRSGPQVGQDGQDPAVGLVGRGEVELGEDAADVLAHGRLGDDQGAGDRPVRPALRDQRRDLPLARGAASAQEGSPWAKSAKAGSRDAWRGPWVPHRHNVPFREVCTFPC